MRWSMNVAPMKAVLTFVVGATLSPTETGERSAIEGSLDPGRIKCKLDAMTRPQMIVFPKTQRHNDLRRQRILPNPRAWKILHKLSTIAARSIGVHAIGRRSGD